MDYRTLLKNLNTGIATFKGDKLILFFSKELNNLEKELFINNFTKAANKTTPLWVYYLIGGKFQLINDNMPTYISKLQASKYLKISAKTISKYLDSGEGYKGLYFFSIKKDSK